MNSELDRLHEGWVLNALSGGPLTVGELARYVGLPPRRAFAAAARLEREGRVRYGADHEGTLTVARREQGEGKSS